MPLLRNLRCTSGYTDTLFFSTDVLKLSTEFPAVALKYSSFRETKIFSHKALYMFNIITFLVNIYSSK